MDVASVSGDVLSLEFVGGASDPGDTVLDVVVVWHLLGGVHCSYICLLMLFPYTALPYTNTHYH